MSNHDGVLLEDIDHKLDAILEGQAAMAYVPQKLEDIDTRLKNVESDVKVIKTVLTEHSQLHKNHSRDIASLRQAIA